MKARSTFSVCQILLVEKFLGAIGSVYSTIEFRFVVVRIRVEIDIRASAKVYRERVIKEEREGIRFSLSVLVRVKCLV